ncbi:hypothetical protein TBLA_0A10630 [Henningerozyma blattae CBS 6284]|uniref:assimilatory sulfite reductase (NADPH) n=1 Tax=Henningerozyma blattae (strain ATCC 34711 / CBS 6284 / DSM 70876 / NBRC 10599 / NRRL Y-10934 / UCD 77-7) TaxID=1071380 RepID=I2GXI9_HENB6|nr:hypothetical protein TBLA_0A10630 [Tetrapisispora blattae CBS 6284]CCH58841.1 hypothetical protein TBLA_0A10630 [Tetrapisispora blattae CBS 6284]
MYKRSLTMTNLVDWLQDTVKSSAFFYTTDFKNSKSEFETVEGSVRLLNNNDPLTDILQSIESSQTTAVADNETECKLISIFTNDNVIKDSLSQLISFNNSKLNNLKIVFNIKLSLNDYSIISDSYQFVKTDNSKIVINDFVSAYTNKKDNSSANVVLHFYSHENVNTTSSDYTKNRETTGKTAIINLTPFGKQLIENTKSVVVYDLLSYSNDIFEEIINDLPIGVENILLLESISSKGSNSVRTNFSPFILNFLQNYNLIVERLASIKNIELSFINSRCSLTNSIIEKLLTNISSEKPIQNLYINGNSTSSSDFIPVDENVLDLELPYIKVLRQLFQTNLNIINEYNHEKIIANSPNFGYGKFLFNNEQKQQLIPFLKSSISKSPDLINKWLQFYTNKCSLKDVKDLKEINNISKDLFNQLKISDNQPSNNQFSIDSFLFNSNWLIGSDSWSFDLGQSGLHNILSSNENINILIIDSNPMNSESSKGKKDIGLYAMNYGHIYVSSVAIYGNYSQMLTAMGEASRFSGPSIVLAYLPYSNENDSSVEILKNTKVAIESGYWPLYRYNPLLTTFEDQFKLDSNVIKENLKKFLDRENLLTLLTTKNPNLKRNLIQSESDKITEIQQKNTKLAFENLLQGLQGPKISIYYASDGGNASSLANKFGQRAKQRGLQPIILSMDDIIIEDLLESNEESTVIFIASTAGQGEFPQDGKKFWDEIKSNLSLDFHNIKFSVFGLGDSQYWPRKEDEHYYNKPAKDLFNKLEKLSAQVLAPLGLGDDQDDDGFLTGYNDWEKKMWVALGVDNVLVGEEPKERTNEDMKHESNFLRGTIVDEFANQTTGRICESDVQIVKFHGFYMQDDRDLREVRKTQGMEPLYSFMIRARLPGGKLTGKQWISLNQLADKYGIGNLKITNRATIQIHGVLKSNLKHTIRKINSVLLDSLAACGDVNRNVSMSALPSNHKVHEQVATVAQQLSEHFLPHTTAYHEIWLKGEDPRDEDKNWPTLFENRKGGPRSKKTLVAGNALVDMEPIYSPVYLPRKFKINLAIPPYNDVDVWSIDLGLIAIVDANDNLIGFNVYVGGGMGTTHNNKKTYPRTGSSFGFVKVEDIASCSEAIMIVQRDNGDRTNRKHARLKYTIDDMGVEVYKSKVEEIWGKKFDTERPYKIESNRDFYGWVKDERGLNHCTLFIENGRVRDQVDSLQKTGLIKIAEFMESRSEGTEHFRLTGNQHAIICDIKDEDLVKVKQILKDHSLDINKLSGIRQSSQACVALPTCPLAMTDSERYLPTLLNKLEDILDEYGIKEDNIVIRMTGCPNGCSRPWLAEIGLIGKAPGTYNLMLGGGYYGQRLNKLYKASVKEEEILDLLRPLFKSWAFERNEGERFGDFVIRKGIVKPTLEGKYFHDDIADDAF